MLFIMTLLFGYLFEPFEISVSEHRINYFLICFIHALTPVVVLILFSLFKIPASITDEWTIKKELLLIILFLLSIGVIQFCIRDILYINANNWSWNYFFEEIRNTFLIGSLFIFILMPINFQRLNKRNIQAAIALNSLNVNKGSIKEIYISNAKFDFEIENMLFAKAEGNYVELYFRNGSKKLRRTTIKKLESDLKLAPFVIKTHRSYLVNIHYIRNVSGNAQGYKLKLKDYSETVPVSRNMISAFNIKMKRA